MTVPGVADVAVAVERIDGHVDGRVLRNHWVTQTYSDLAAGLAELLDPDTANWCTFGTWASCTVGQNL